MALVRQRGVIRSEAHTGQGTRLRVKLPAALLARFDPYRTESAA
jgi:hypothetical protein